MKEYNKTLKELTTYINKSGDRLLKILFAEFQSALLSRENERMKKLDEIIQELKRRQV